MEFVTSSIKISFDNETGMLTSIVYKNNVIKLNSLLWRVELKTCEMVENLTLKDMSGFRFSRRGKLMYLNWENGLLKVTVSLEPGNNRLKWNISVKSTADECWINKVIFPIIGCVKPISPDGKDDYLLLPWQNGWIIKDPIHTLLCKKINIPFWLGRGNGKYENEYPAQYSYQFAAYYSPERYGYYFSTEDGEAYIKTMGFYYNEKDGGFDFAITNYPENMGSVKNYSVPYDFVLGFFEGDWQKAVNIYRQWALKQKWCKEKLNDKYIPTNLKKTDLWRINHNNYALGTRTSEYYNTSVKLKEEIDCNLALHWYGWNMGEHDVNYPEYISDEQVKRGWLQELTQWNSRFTEKGIVKIPYVNARLWDVNTKSWNDVNAGEAALLGEHMELYREPWKEDNLKPMCPATLKWRNKVVEFSGDYILENRFDGIYLDQVASYNAALCFNEKHPHPVGGGKWWNDSYHLMVNSLRNVVGKEKILTTESCCETYIDVFDLFLVLDTNMYHIGFCETAGGENCEPAPLFRMIYGDYALSYGSICRFSDPAENFEFKFIRNLLWGILPTVEGLEMSELQKDNAYEYISVIKKGVDFYIRNKELIMFGRLKEIPAYDCEKMKIC